jgi:hypothetical protein
VAALAGALVEAASAEAVAVASVEEELPADGRFTAFIQKIYNSSVEH